MDLSKLSSAESWEPDFEDGTIEGILGMVWHGNVNTVTRTGEQFSHTDLEFIALARSDLDIKQRRGWHTEKCDAINQWFVPQLTEYVLCKILSGGLKGVGEAGLDACYQMHHDVGLLTQADRWYSQHVEGKQDG